MTFSRLNGAVLHWDATGPAAAPPLVFANSLGSDLRIWDAVARELASDYRIIRYDERGHGLSDTTSPFAVADHADDLRALLDVAGIEACALAGISVGGMIAQSFAARYPDRVQAVVLCDTAPRIGTAESWATRIEAVERGGLAAVADAALERWFAPGYRRRCPDEWAGWRTMLLRTPADGYLAMCAAIRDADLTTGAAAIQAPCLCVAGDQDVSTPPELVRQMAAMIPNGRFEVIEEAGHLPCVERPERLAALIRNHLREVHRD